MSIRACLLLVLLITAMLIASVTPALAQPRFRFRAVVDGELYPGEPGAIRVNVFNENCPDRQRIEVVAISYEDQNNPYSRYLRNADELFISELQKRVEEAKGLGYLTGFSYAINSTIGYGGDIRHNLTAWFYGLCVGEPIRVERVRVWFPWQGYGRSLYGEAAVGRELSPPDPLKFVFEGEFVNNATVSVPFTVPADVPSEALGRQGPVVEVDAIYHGQRWTFGRPFGEPEVVTSGYVDVRPFRTFRLRVTDAEGSIPLVGARVSFRALVYQYSLDLTTDEKGSVEVRRLPDGYTYSVWVSYHLRHLNLTAELLAASAIGARDLAKGELRVELYTLRVYPVDVKGRALEGAEVTVRPMEVLHRSYSGPLLSNSSAGGYASFYLLPLGNYSVSVSWVGMEVGKSAIYLGHHPTYGFREPKIVVSCDVDDLVVLVRDASGNPMPANVTVRSGSIELSGEAPNGTAVFRQLPRIGFEVEARSYLKAFGKEVRGLSEAVPGKESVVTMPVYGVRIRPLSKGGETINATVRLGPLGASGYEAVFPGVPEGTYPIIIAFRGLVVYRGELKVDGPVSAEFRTEVYRLRLSVMDLDGEEVAGAVWEVAGPVSARGKGSRMELGLVPDASLNVTVRGILGGRETVLLSTTVRPSSSGNATLTVPVGRIRLEVLWSDGRPVSGRVLVAGEDLEVKGGKAETRAKHLAGRYELSVFGTAGEPIRRETVTHSGTPIRITIPFYQVEVLVRDSFGAPVRGAKVDVLWGGGGRLLDSGTTGDDGRFTSGRIPAGLDVVVRASYGQHAVEEAATGRTAIEVRMPFVLIGGIAVEPLWLAAPIVIAGAIASLTVVRKLRRKA